MDTGTPIPGTVVDGRRVLQPAFEKWPWVATSLRGIQGVHPPRDFIPIARPLSTIFDVAGLDERIYLWVAGCDVRECTVQDLIGYRLDIEVHESQLTFVFAADFSWVGAISDEDKLFLYGDWERAKRV